MVPVSTLQLLLLPHLSSVVVPACIAARAATPPVQCCLHAAVVFLPLLSSAAVLCCDARCSCRRSRFPCPTACPLSHILALLCTLLRPALRFNCGVTTLYCSGRDQGAWLARTRPSPRSQQLFRRGLASLETLCGPGNKFKVAPLRLLQQAGQGVDRCRGRPSTQHMISARAHLRGLWSERRRSNERLFGWPVDALRRLRAILFVDPKLR